MPPRSSKKSTKMSNSEGETQKRRKKVFGLHETSVARELKHGSRTERVSKNAVTLTVKMAEKAIKELAKKCCKSLEISKKKTVTISTLEDCIEAMDCSFWDPSTVHHAKTSKERTKGDRRSIATESCRRVFSTGCPLGKKQYQMAEDAKDALTLLTIEYVRNLGKAAGKVTEAAKRKTLSSTDVATANTIRSQ